MEGLTQPPASPERDGDEGFALTQPPCADEAGADAPPRIAFVLRPTAAAAAASTEPVELVAESTVVVGREPPADILLVDMERTATTTLRPFVSARHATLRVALLVERLVPAGEPVEADHVRRPQLDGLQLADAAVGAGGRGPDGGDARRLAQRR